MDSQNTKIPDKIHSSPAAAAAAAVVVVEVESSCILFFWTAFVELNGNETR